MPQRKPQKKQTGLFNWVKPLTTNEEKAQQQARQQAEAEKNKAEVDRKRQREADAAAEAQQNKRGPGRPSKRVISN